MPIIPDHLKPFVSNQEASFYSPIDHAAWRFILRISKAFFAKAAHAKYLSGLEETGISSDRIPLVSEMDEKLQKFGWRAVPVSGFIPPAIFMEFQSLGILPIAREMRTLDHLAYTPAPDIVHEAAGHAPIIADPEYAQYLKNYGEVSRKAIFSWQDQALFDAIRELSDIKELPTATPEQIAKSEANLNRVAGEISYISEANYLARMNWWTVEYGLVGSLNSPKIYGAGLLSSVGESYHCLTDEVKKIPFSLECVEMSYDITRPQPQLFVTPDFVTLSIVLEQFAETMAFRRGGVSGLNKAQESRTPVTVELDSGIQVSGVLKGYLNDSVGRPSYLHFEGPSQLSYKDQELEGHGADYHREGYGASIGKVEINGALRDPSALTDAELSNLQQLKYESGVVVKGQLKSHLRRDGKLLLLSWQNCTVTCGAEILFKPEWGTFDLGCGIEVISVFGGAADRIKYLKVTGGLKVPPKIEVNAAAKAQCPLTGLYSQVRKIRDVGDSASARTELSQVVSRLEQLDSQDWLLRLECLELNLSWKMGAVWESQLRNRLIEISKTSAQKAEMISRGLSSFELSQR